MVIDYNSHPRLVVRDDAGRLIKDVVSVDTDTMMVMTLRRDARGRIEIDGESVSHCWRRLISYRFEPNNVLRVQLGEEIEA